MWIMDSLQRYYKATATTAIYPDQGKLNGLIYTTLGLSGEAGELANKVKKILRDNKSVIDDATRLELIYELGDILWYVSQAAHELQVNLPDVAQMNIDKLSIRKINDKIGGSGDHR